MLSLPNTLSNDINQKYFHVSGKPLYSYLKFKKTLLSKISSNNFFNLIIKNKVVIAMTRVNYTLILLTIIF